MKLYEKPMAEVIDFAAESIMDGNIGDNFGSIVEDVEPLSIG